MTFVPLSTPAMKVLANIEAARRADAERLAAFFGYDVARLQFQRDRLFWGRSITRARDLSRYELALEIAKQRELKAFLEQAAVIRLPAREGMR